MATAKILGDSQGQGELAALGPVLARHGLELDQAGSYVRAGADSSELAQHASSIGAADVVLLFTGGGNDPASLVNDQNRYRDKLTSIVNTLRAGGAQRVVLVGPFRSDDPSVQALHDAARLVQGRGIPGASWIDGYQITAFVPHPAGNPTHWAAAGYRAIALELEKALFDHGEVTAIGLVGTLTFLGAVGAVTMELLYARAAGDVA